MKVRISPNAREQLREIRAQLPAKSPLRRTLTSELRVLLELIETSPEIGTPIATDEDVMVRRSYLRRTRLHVYHVILPDAPEVIAVWPARSGTSPRFGGAKH